MKKRIIISLILLILVLSVSVGSHILLLRQTDMLYDATEKLLIAIQKGNVPKKEYTALSDRFGKCRTLYRIFLVHGNITELETTIESIGFYLDSKDNHELLRLGIRCRILTEDLKRSIVFSTENILKLSSVYR